MRSGAGLHGGGLAEEIVLVGGGQSGVGVGRADHAELVGVGAQLLLELEPELQAPNGHTRTGASPAS